MRKTTKGKGFFGAVVSAVLVAGFMLLLAAALLMECFGGVSLIYTTGILLFCVLLYLAVAVGVIVCLYQRWKEIQGGEEDEAKKY